METIKGVLIISPFFHPNIGGVETHLTDLTKELSKKYKVFVQTYSPLTTANTSWQKIEKYKNLTIYRHHWFGKNLFHKLEKYTILQFLYLTPYLFFHSFLWMLQNHKKISIIHSHGFNAAFIGHYLSKIYNKKHIISTHAIYDHLKPSPILLKLINQSHITLTLSDASKKQLIAWSANNNKLSTYKYWIDLDIFKPVAVKNKKFTILFVGRLIQKKGVKILVKIAQKLPSINFTFIGTGPLENYLESISKKYKNIKFLGKINNKFLPKYYSQSHLLCVPSLYQEGFGRVVMESVACGTPVLASNLGGLPEALDNTVSILIKPTLNNLSASILKLYQNKNIYNKLSHHCRPYAISNFSSKNIFLITKYYD